MNTKKFLIMIAVVILLSAPAFAMQSFKGLVPMTVEGLCTAGTNLDVAVEAVLPQNALKTLGGGVEYACIAKDAVVGTACMLVKGGVGGVCTAGANLDVALEAVLPQNALKTAGGGIGLVRNGIDAILKFAFGP